MNFDENGLGYILGDFGRFWAILGDFGRFWAILGDFGRFWAILGDFFTNSSGHLGNGKRRLNL
jgi:hypothetical protein